MRHVRVARVVGRLASLCLLGVAAGVPARAQEVHAPANEDCLACHSDAELKRADGTALTVDPRAFNGSAHAPLTCVSCHADLSTVTEYPHAEKLAKVACVSCHDEIGATYHDSIHARAREKSGLIVAPGCSDCHGTHTILPRTAEQGRLAPDRIPATCGTCHAGIQARYDAGVHAAALGKAGSHAPTCITCHTAHAIQRADTDVWKLGVARDCGTCHMNVAESFARTFHGKVTQLGFTSVATCADCHGAHDILPRANPASMVSPARLVQTCGRCHAGATPSFVKYDPHPNPRDYARSPLLWWLNRFYTVLIAGCFGFFGLHSLLWFNRARRSRAGATGTGGSR